MMNLIYSLEGDITATQYRTTYCKIQTDPRTATKFVYFRMRRYCYDDRVKRFVPGRFDVTKDATIGYFLNESSIKNGLTMAEST